MFDLMTEAGRTGSFSVASVKVHMHCVRAFIVCFNNYVTSVILCDGELLLHVKSNPS